jgi:AcrR family transcriptional regulator
VGLTVDNKENRKVKYTKKVIKESLYRLLEEMPLQKITVKGLCELADINRGTFYTHYSDIYDLVEKLENDIVKICGYIVDFDQIGKGNQYDLYRHVFVHLKDNMDEYRLILLNPPSIRCLDPLLSKVYFYHAASIRKATGWSDEMIAYAYTFVLEGCKHVVYHWIERGLVETPDEMAELLTGIIYNETAVE